MIEICYAGYFATSLGSRLLYVILPFQMGKKVALVGVGKRSRRSRHRHNAQTLSSSASVFARAESTANVSMQAHAQGIRLETRPSQNLHDAVLGAEVNASIAASASGEGNRNPGNCVQDGVEDENVTSTEAFRDEVEEPADNDEILSDGVPRELITSEITCSNGRRLLLDNWRVLWALLLTNGSRELSKEQYQSVRTLAYGFGVMNASSRKVGGHVSECTGEAFSTKVSVLPHYSTLVKKYKPLVTDVLAPRAVKHKEVVDESKAGAKSNARSSSDEAEITVRTILPSEYARSDMATPDVWSEMCSTSLSHAQTVRHVCPTVSSQECVDIFPVVGARHWFYGHKSSNGE